MATRNKFGAMLLSPSATSSAVAACQWTHTSTAPFRAERLNQVTRTRPAQHAQYAQPLQKVLFPTMCYQLALQHVTRRR